MTNDERNSNQGTIGDNAKTAPGTTGLELDEGSHDALKVISTLGSSVGFDKILNGNSLIANIEHLRTKKNIFFFEQLNKTREELKSVSEKVDLMESHILDLKSAASNSSISTSN